MLKPKNRLAKWIQKKKKDPYIHIYALFKTPTSLQGKNKNKQIECERMEENITCKQESQESWSSNTHIRQNRC